MQNTCYGCKDRKVGCHSNCEIYKNYRKELDETNKNKRQQKRLDSLHSK